MATVQIRDVDPAVLEALKRRAAERGVSLTEYLRKELDRLATTPTTTELIARIRGRELYTFAETSAEAIRHEREERDRQLDSR